MVKTLNSLQRYSVTVSAVVRRSFVTLQFKAGADRISLSSAPKFGERKFVSLLPNGVLDILFNALKIVIYSLISLT